MIPELERLVVVGVVAEAIKKEYGPHVHVPPEPEYCNVRGIEWLAKSTEGFTPILNLASNTCRPLLLENRRQK